MALMSGSQACAWYLELITTVRDATADLEADGGRWPALQDGFPAAASWPDLDMEALSAGQKAQLAELMQCLQQVMAAFAAAGKRWDARQQAGIGVIHLQRRILDNYSA